MYSPFAPPPLSLSLSLSLSLFLCMYVMYYGPLALFTEQRIKNSLSLSQSLNTGNVIPVAADTEIKASCGVYIDGGGTTDIYGFLTHSSDKWFGDSFKRCQQVSGWALLKHLTGTVNRLAPHKQT